MPKSDIAPAYGRGNAFRTRHISMVEIGQRAGNTQNALKPRALNFFVSPICQKDNPYEVIFALIIVCNNIIAYTKEKFISIFSAN